MYVYAYVYIDNACTCRRAVHETRACGEDRTWSSGGIRCVGGCVDFLFLFLTGFFVHVFLGRVVGVSSRVRVGVGVGVRVGAGVRAGVRFRIGIGIGDRVSQSWGVLEFGVRGS